MTLQMITYSIIQKSHEARLKAKQLLEQAKNKAEEMIEKQKCPTGQQKN